MSNELSSNKENTLKIVMYPNPANYSLTVQLNQQLATELFMEITDMRGASIIKMLIPASTDKAEVNISSLSNGIYYCRFSSPKKLLTEQKLVVIR
jgi:hypothetical protein